MKALMDTTFLLNPVCRICTWSSWTWTLSQMSYNQVEQIALQDPFGLIGIGTWQWAGDLSLLALILKADWHLTLSLDQLPISSPLPVAFTLTLSSPPLFSLIWPLTHRRHASYGLLSQIRIHLDIWGQTILCCKRGWYGIFSWSLKLAVATPSPIMRCQNPLAYICSCEILRCSQVL